MNNRLVLILLDIDGVMVTTPSWKKVELLDDGFSSFNPMAVRCLNNLLLQTGASIILTTSHKSRFSSDDWVKIFQKRGINIDHIAKLESNVSSNRREEIMSWYANGNSREDFIIIDDDTSLNDLPYYLKDRLILTKSLMGLNHENVVDVLSIINKNNRHAIS